MRHALAPFVAALFTACLVAHAAPAAEPAGTKPVDPLAAKLAKARKDNARLVRQIRKLELEIRQLKEQLADAQRTVQHRQSELAAARIHLDSTQADGTVEGGRGFTYGNFSWGGDEHKTSLLGEIKNGSGKSYATAIFQANIYDQNGHLVETAPFMLNQFQAEQTKAFDVDVYDLPHRRDYRFKFSFEGGAETRD